MASLHKSESGAQLLARLSAKAELNTLDLELCPWGYEIHNVVEIIGEEGTGKTQYLLHIIAKCILPPAWKNISLGGLGIGVMFVDTDFHFSILRLASILEARILATIQDSEKNPAQVKCSEEEVEAFIQSCLERLYLVQCGSSFQLLLTLHSVDSILCSKQEISVLMVDSLSAFYWIDRLSGGDSIQFQELHMKKIVAVLKSLVETHSLVLFATQAAIFNKKVKTDSAGASSGDFSPYQRQQIENKSSSNPPEYLHYLTKDWQQIVTNKIVLRKKSKDSNAFSYFAYHEFKKSKAVNKCFVIDGMGIKFSNS